MLDLHPELYTVFDFFIAIDCLEACECYEYIVLNLHRYEWLSSFRSRQ